MNADQTLHEDSEVKACFSIARHILEPLTDNSSQPDAYGELRYELDGDTIFFTFNGQRLKGETYYGLYSGDDLLGLGYALQSGSLNIQGFRPNGIMEGNDFKLFSIDMGTILPHELILFAKS